jgi:Domain of unknown function (DUF4082)/Bacterial Ig-like domain/Bacterial Ig domain
MTPKLPLARTGAGRIVWLLRKLQAPACRAAFVIWALLSASWMGVAGQDVLAAGCTGNAIVCENQLSGTDRSAWDVSGAGDPSIQGFATDISVNVGTTVNFKINSTTASSYTIDIYRMGYYQGNGARKVASVAPSVNLPQSQPACLTNAPTGLVDCGNWAVSASWAVPPTAVSGIYFARLTTPSGAASHIVFIVRNDGSTSDIVFRTNDSTWEAYNDYGGNNLYYGTAPSSDGRAYKVSYNRPFNDRSETTGYGTSNYVFYAEYPMIRWLEANGYDVSYIATADVERASNLLLNHRVVLTSGHDEYWSAGERAALQAARDAGVSLALFTGNDSFWKTRWETSIDGSGTAYRTLVCYKETKLEKAIDPADPPTWTGTWRDATLSPPADGGRPENALLGNLFMVNRGSAAITVPAQFGKLRLWRNTAAASLGAGQMLTLGAQTLGFEWDVDVDNGFRPAGDFQVSSTTVSVPEYMQDNGNTYLPATVVHSLNLYRAPSGALVFGAGTVQWSWGLDTNHDTSPDVGPSSPDPNMQQATVNLLADMGAQPGSLQSGLVGASLSTDKTAPTSTVAAPTAGSTIASGSATTISGTATDAGGGVVAGIEVSTDGGTTWHPAQGTTSWSYTWTPETPGPAAIRSRAVDDSGNLEAPSTGISVTVGPHKCPCSIFSSTATPATASANDSSQVEVGVKFTADSDGYITGISFYKGAGNTGTHVANLWTSTGQLIASGAFTSETASGWQTVTFGTPVAINGGTVYVASYHTTTGHYAATVGAFTAPLDAWPLHAPSGANGVYQYGASQFPTQFYNSTNYWVDVVYATTLNDTVAPVVTTVSPVPNATNVFPSAVTARFSKSVVASSISFGLAAGSTPVAGATTYDNPSKTVTFTPSAPLAQGTTFTATVSGATDSSGNVMASPYTWSFTTLSCPCSMWPSTATPAQASVNDTGPVEVGVRFTSDNNGYINGIRFYKGAANTGSHVGNLWTASGQLIASGTFSGESASGWQQMLFSSPVAVTAGTTYVASYHTNTGGYSYTGAYFGSAYDAAPLHASASIAGTGNGVYLYGPSAFPTQTYNASNYWVDVVFNMVFSDTVPPSLSAETPAPGATAAASTTATATFTEPVNVATISFAIKSSGGTIVAAALTYNSANLTATLTPAASLAQGTYTATVSGAADPSGNVMAPVSWTFTATACPCTIFPASATPTTASVNDPSSVELGVKFRTATNGTITGVRFYKGAANTGTHVASLWTATGTLLATATFTAESATGWQQVNFATPVSVTANTIYVVSYHTTTGNYAADGGYFATQGAGGYPVTALAAGVAGPNGVYAYSAASTFPTNSWNSTNYWVDVVFAGG